MPHGTPPETLSSGHRRCRNGCRRRVAEQLDVLIDDVVARAVWLGQPDLATPLAVAWRGVRCAVPFHVELGGESLGAAFERAWVG